MTPRTALLAFAMAAAFQPAVARTLHILTYPGAPQTYPIAINNARKIVGQYIGVDGVPHAFAARSGHYEQIDPSGPIGTAAVSAALSVNNTGAVAGFFGDAAGARHGFVLRGGRVRRIDIAGAAKTYAYGINDRDEVIGIWLDAAGTQHAWELRADSLVDLDQPGGVTTPFSINDRGAIVGEFQDAPPAAGHGFTRQPTGAISYVDAPGAPPDSSFLISVNNRSTKLGGYVDNSGNVQNFLQQGQDFVAFTLPKRLGAISVMVETINDEGDVVGYYTVASGAPFGFISTE